MMRPVATTLAEAQRALDVQPLIFGKDAELRGAQNPEATAESFYVQAPKPAGRERDPIRARLSQLKRQLLEATAETKLFLSGHIGSGKSTELNRLFADPELRQKFWMVKLRFEEQEVATLDASQVLFAIAAQIHASAAQYLSTSADWMTPLRELNKRIYGATGIELKEATVSAEYNLVLFKLRQDLKLSETYRKQFRELGETQQSILKDLLTKMAKEVEANVPGGRRLLLLIDDLDKVRGLEQQRDIFVTHFAQLFVPPFPVLYTVPAGVASGDSVMDLRNRLTHLFPRRVLAKAAEHFDPEQSFLKDTDQFFRLALAARVEPALFEPDAVKLAVIYSGGVLREFFRLLGLAVGIARDSELDSVDVQAMREALADERRTASQGLLLRDWSALMYVHRNHALRDEVDRLQLDRGRLLETHNGDVYYEANPLLWKSLSERSSLIDAANASAPTPARS